MKYFVFFITSEKNCQQDRIRLDLKNSKNYNLIKIYLHSIMFRSKLYKEFKKNSSKKVSGNFSSLKIENYFFFCTNLNFALKFVDQF